MQKTIMQTPHYNPLNTLNKAQSEIFSVTILMSIHLRLNISVTTNLNLYSLLVGVHVPLLKQALV